MRIQFQGPAESCDGTNSAVAGIFARRGGDRSRMANKPRSRAKIGRGTGTAEHPGTKRNFLAAGPFCSRARVVAIKNRKSKIQNEEGHSSRRRRRNTPLSADENRLQTASPNIRQTDDLLSAGDFNARRPTRGAHHLDSKRSANAGRLFGRGGATRHSDRVRRAAETGRDRTSLFDRREIYWELGCIAHSWRQHFLWETRLLSRRTRHRAWRVHFWISSARSATLRRRRVRRRGQGNQSRGKTKTTEKSFCGSRA